MNLTERLKLVVFLLFLTAIIIFLASESWIFTWMKLLIMAYLIMW